MAGPIGRSVGRKLALAVSSLLAGLSILFVGFLLVLSRRQLDDLNNQWIKLLTSSVEGSISTVLEQGHGPAFRSVVKEVSGREEIEAIRVVDLDGKVHFSAHQDEVGDMLEDRLLKGLPRTTDTATVILRSPGRIDSLKPIVTEPACARCHPAKGELGVLQISISTARADAAVKRYQSWLGLLGFVPILFVVVAILLGTKWVVVRPLKGLARVMHKAGEGDLLHRAEVAGEDEIALLARDFNTMLGQLTRLTAEKMERERELAATQEEIKARAALDEKARIIEVTNKELSEKNRELDVLFKLGREMSGSLELPRLFENLTRSIAGLGYRQFVLLVWDDSLEALVVRATHGFSEQEDIRGMTFRKGEGIAGECARTGERILVADTRKDSRFLHYKGKRSVDGAILCTPLRIQDRVLGVLAFERTMLEGFTEDEINFLQTIANAAAIAIENARLYERTRELSATDALTGIPNRRTFFERLEHELRRADRFHRRFSLLMIDIDHFKRLNDSQGHLAGDEVLRRSAGLFKESVREVDLIARYGGEEFVVILPDADKVEAGAVAEKLRNRVHRTRFEKADGQPGGRLTVSVGVASYPTDATDGGGLLDAADFALYRAKESGRNRVVMFDEALRRDLEKQRVSGRQV